MIPDEGNEFQFPRICFNYVLTNATTNFCLLGVGVTFMPELSSSFEATVANEDSPITSHNKIYIVIFLNPPALSTTK